MNKINYCPCTLAQGFSTYSPTALKKMFNGKKVSHILDFDAPSASEEVAELFWAPLDAILDARHTRDTEIHIRGIVMNRDAIHYRGHVIWGMTEQILRDFAEIIK